MSPAPLKRLASADQDISPPPSKRKLTTTTTSKAAANFFKPTSQKETEPERTQFHTVHETLLIARHGNPTTTPHAKPLKLAAFDLDSTLITTKSNLKFARDQDDWKWWHASVPARLRRLHDEGYVLVILSNQGGVSLKPDAKAPKGAMKSLANFKGRVRAVLDALDLPLSVYAATGKDGFRKPRAGMWERMRVDYGVKGEGEVDLGGSLFVGDAAGRAEDKGRKRDFSCSDRDLAANVGVRFQTPEEFFLGEAVRPFERGFDPGVYLDVELDSKTDATPVVFRKANEKDIVLFCGSPGAGKSTFYWQHMEPIGYERVNQDLLKTRDKCLKVATQHLEDSRSVVVDNTNADIETRAAWLALGKKLGVPLRLVHFTSSAKLCEHNDTVRALTGDLMNPEQRTMLPKMAFSGFASRYREPRLAEGFADITKVDFKFSGTDEQKRQWRKFWVS